jgi:CysZ protein
MIDAAVKALQQMFSPEFRSVLIKAVLLALVLVVLMGASLHQVLNWLTVDGGIWVQARVGDTYYTLLSWLIWIFSIATTFGIVIGGVFLMPAVTAFVGSFYVDEIAGEVERVYYPAEPLGEPVPFWPATWHGIKTALLAIGIYLLALPFLLFAGVGLFILFFAAAYLLSREYFELAAMRFRSEAEARALRKQHQVSVFFAGILIAAFVSIPIVNLATPLFAMALMVHMHKKLSGRKVELIEAQV